MPTEIKFCGLTLDEDVRQVAPLGGSYAGVILAGGPRKVSPERGALILACAARPVKRAAVFGDVPLAQVDDLSLHMYLDVIQLHADPAPEFVARVREATGIEVWAAVHVGEGDDLAARVAALDGVADVILLDALVPGRFGGSGVRFDWNVVTPEARPRRSRLAIAGGLTPENVGDAIQALAPDIVDVSSGVERRRGVKDHDRMRAFADAVRRHDRHP